MIELKYGFAIPNEIRDLGNDFVKAAKKHQVSCFQNILELPEKLIKHNA